jgi:hypothetical protein
MAPTSPRVGALRILLGMFQGLLLYLLYRSGDELAWPATSSMLFVPLALAALLVPPVLISGLGHMSRRRLFLWGAVVLLVLIGLGCHDAWRVADLPLPPQGQPNVRYVDSPGLYRSLYPSALLVPFAMAGLFIAHTLVLSAARDGRRIAAYATYFDIAWKLGVQLAFSGLFTGVSWLVLLLGSELFELLKLSFLTELIRKEWFAIPVTAFAFACAMHLTDMKPSIVRGIRGLLLVLLSWLLPVIVLLAGGFLLALPFTGLAPLWGTRRAAEVLLCAAAVLVVLINAAWQDGSDTTTARVVRLAARAAALLLAPLVLIAMYALYLRVRDYGWTGDRVSAAACMLVAACYATGYFRAALRPGWLQSLAAVNIATACVVIGVLLLVFSPLLDPARVSVASQLARLASGKVTADRFDFVFLRFDGERYGRAALDRLGQTPMGPDAALVLRQVAAVRKLQDRRDGANIAMRPADLGANLVLRQPNAHLPASFLHTDWALKAHGHRYPACLRLPGKHCDVFMLDVNGDGKPEVLVGSREDAVAAPEIVVLAEDAGGQWSLLARAVLPQADCQSLRDDLAAGKVGTAAAGLADIEIGGVRAHLQPVTPGPACVRGRR